MRSPHELSARHRDILLSCRLLRGLMPVQIDRLAGIWEVRTYAPGAHILREGEPDRFVYVLLDGRVELVKATLLGTKLSRIGTLGAGDTFGEVKIVDRQPSSASVVAASDVTAVAIDLDVFDRQAELADARAIVWHNVGQILAERLRQTSLTGAEAIQRELAESEARAYAGRFLLFVFCIIAVPQLAFSAMTVIPEARGMPDTLLSFAFIVWTVVPVWLALRRSPFPLRAYGLTLEGGSGCALRALAWTIPLLFLLVLVKLAVVRWVPSMAGQPLLDPAIRDWRVFAAGLLLYAIHAPFREFVGRGVLQGALQLFMRVPAGRTSWKAILMASLLFASGQGFHGFAFAVVSFAVGLFWGWLFARQGSLVGVTVSHIAVGWWGLDVLGLRAVFGGA